MGCDFRVSVSGSHGGKGDVQRTPALWGRLHLPPEEGRGGATSPRGGDRKPLAAPSRRIQWSLTPPPYALLKMELNSFMWVPPTSGPAHRYSRLEHFHPVSLMIFCSKAVSEEKVTCVCSFCPQGSAYKLLVEVCQKQQSPSHAISQTALTRFLTTLG